MVPRLDIWVIIGSCMKNHSFKFDVDKFGSTELRPAPTPLSGEEILECTKDIVTFFGKDPSGKKPASKRC